MATRSASTCEVLYGGGKSAVGEGAKYGETVHTSTDHKEIEGECGCARNGGHG